MPTLLIKNAHILTMDDHQREIPEGGLFIRDGFIEQVGVPRRNFHSPRRRSPRSQGACRPARARQHPSSLLPNPHARRPAAQDANLFNWLKTLYPIWARLTPDDIFISTSTALAELALSGCTTASDHLYLFPNGSKLDDEIAAASEIGVRLHASRGSMSLGESKGGLPAR